MQLFSRQQQCTGQMRHQDWHGMKRIFTRLYISIAMRIFSCKCYQLFNTLKLNIILWCPIDFNYSG